MLGYSLPVIYEHNLGNKMGVNLNNHKMKSDSCAIPFYFAKNYIHLQNRFFLKKYPLFRP